MAGKNKDKDLLSDFFGDDVDWLDDDEAAKAAAAAEAQAADAEEHEASPADKAPPTPAAPEAAAEPEAPSEPDEPADETLPVAPTDAEGVSLTPLDVAPIEPGHASVDDTVGAYLEPLTNPGVDRDPDDLETVTDAEPQRPLDDIVVEEDGPQDIVSNVQVEIEATQEVTSDVADGEAADEDADEGVAPGSDPEPAAVESVSAEAEIPEAPAVPAPPPEPRLAWTPQSDEQTWRELAEGIESAASHTIDAAGRVHLLVEVARIRAERFEDLAAAADRLAQAKESGPADDSYLRVVIETTTRQGDLTAAAQAIAARAATLEGPAAAEAWQASAMIARHRLQDLAQAEACLRKAVEADGADYASLSLLRDQLAARGREPERAEVLHRICEIATGRVAAEAWWELGRLRHRLGDETEALQAYAAGLAADPTHAQCFLALQALHIAAADDLNLGELYLAEAARPGQRDAADFYIEAARAFVDARDLERADAAFQSAIEAGHPLARREQQAWLLATDRTADYAKALQAETEALEPEQGKAFALYRLGLVLEQDLSDPDGAIAAYRAAVEADPAAGPAAEAVARVLQAAGRHEELLTFWEQRLEGADDADLQASVLLRMAEVSEAALSDDDRARGYLVRILELRADDRPALYALRRIYQHLSSWPELAGVYETLATVDEAPEIRAQHLARAGNVWRFRVHDDSKARAAWESALALRPAHVLALDELVDLLEEQAAWADQARVLRAASDAAVVDGDRVRLAYRAGRVYLDRLQDLEQAAEAFRQCLRFQAGFLPALGMLKQIAAASGEGGEVHRLYLEQAQTLTDPAARNWRLLAAANLAARLPGGDPGRELGAILENEGAHPGALAAQELRLLTLGAKVGLLNLYRRALQGLETGARRDAILVRVAQLFEALGDAAGIKEPLDELAASGADTVPFRMLARLAEGQRHWEQADAALARSEHDEDRLERARIQAQRLDRADEATQTYQSLLDHPEVAVTAALGAAALAQRAGQAELLLAAHTVLAEQGASEPVRAAHALWSGQLAEAAGRPDEALRLYRLTLSLRPASTTAFDGARRLLLPALDVQSVRSLWQQHRPEDLHGLALDLEQLEDHAGVAEVWKQAVDGGRDDLATLSRLEVALTHLEDWPGVYAVATRRAAQLQEPAAKEVVDAKRRWLLAEKLSGTDEAWELYQSLHEENPEDREVTSALARIAMARGETRLAIGYLETLAQGAEDPATAADLLVRVAEVHEGGKDVDSARQAYLDALDHVPDHGPALAGLKRLAVDGEDWPGLIGVLQREVALADGESRVALLREVAQTTQEHVDDPQLAMDAWRAVVEAAPEDLDALRALVALAESEASWSMVVEYGLSLADLLEDSDRTRLLSHLGAVTQDQLGADGVILFERALDEGPPDRDAAERLLAIYKSHGDSRNTVRMLVLLSELVPEPADQAALLSDGGDIELRTHADRAAAATLYARSFDLLPSEPRAVRFLAGHYLAAGDTARALPVFEQLAPIREEGEDLDDFDVKIELSTFYYQLATLLRDAGRGAEAIPHIERALHFNPNHQPSLELAAPEYVRSGAWEKANDVLRHLLQLTGGMGDRERTAETYAQLGVVERALGRTDKAEKRFAKALELVPNHVGGLRGMALVYEDGERWQDLLNVYNTIIHNAPSPSDVTAAYLTKGRVLDEHMGRPDKASQHYERSLAYDANQPKALLRLAELALRRSDWAEAAGLAKRGISMVSAPGVLRADLLLCQAVARSATGDADAASAALAQAQQAAPDLALGDDALSDLEAVRDGIRHRLPR